MMRWILIFVIGLQVSRSDGQQIDSTVLVLNAKLTAISSVGNFYANSEDELAKFLRITDYQFLNQRGFDRMIFIKIMLRDRYFLEHYLFLKTLNPDEYKAVAVEPNWSKFDSLKRDRLEKVFYINDTTPNHVLEQWLYKISDTREPYNANPELDVDVIIAYWPDSSRYFVLNRQYNRMNLSDFRKVILCGIVLDKNLKAHLRKKWCDQRKVKLPRSLVRELYIDGIPLQKFLW